jgi:hypothetical protein
MPQNYILFWKKISTFFCFSFLNSIIHEKKVVFMSYECKNLSGTFCEKRKQECDPGAKGCVLEGKFSFPLKENGKKKK